MYSAVLDRYAAREDVESMGRTHMGQVRGRWSVLVGGALVVALSMSLGLAGVGVASPDAHHAKRKTMKVDASARLKLVRKDGAILHEKGTVTGTPSGTVTAKFNTSNAAKVTGTVTFKPSSGGSITVTAVAYPQSTGEVVRFNGNFAVSKGTGRYASALGSGTLSGTVNRKTWAVKVNAKGTVTY